MNYLLESDKTSGTKNFEANQLRLGNIIVSFAPHHADKYWEKVESIGHDDGIGVLCVNGVPHGEWEFLLINHQWLEKFGFVNTKYSYYTLQVETYAQWGINLEEAAFYNDYPFAACNYIADVKYIHQLQNLYHALTGKELTIQ